ncbi:hypothetical protein M3P05_05555 [Sansalvadorimonas sp. 2012CJ34-2]|uniref:Uncharacterized protein n=1 Tax=Parendozoicomonas callyspongiae TaxID=2942213 RepID=A0ABT0PDJ6_9GAMM|nr:hypothetical protein [Sansalvadorimonas sp. 2012CJ34-2]MCL6269410.1 hypothetical protein [Sansalvadorimonas sp. 2012CJ34-2]
MSYAVSEVLSPRQIATVERIGNILLPPHSELPAFSETGCLYHVDTILRASSKDDLQSLKTVLTVLSFLPDTVLCWLLARLEVANLFSPGSSLPDWIRADLVTAQFRLLLLGLKGLVFTLYYSGQGSPYKNSRVHEALGYRVHCQPDISASPVSPQ